MVWLVVRFFIAIAAFATDVPATDVIKPETVVSGVCPVHGRNGGQKEKQTRDVPGPNLVILPTWVSMIGHLRPPRANTPGSPLYLVLLCHKRWTQQNGQQGSCLSRNLASLIRSVAIEYGLCRSARMRRAAGLEVGRNFLGA
jgi:hypothetical protein